MHTWNWDDLRIILAVAEHRSLAAAARALGVNHTTVLRRITTFEKRHAIRLFDRLPSGYTTSEAGEELLKTARAMQGVMIDLERKLVGQDLRLEGTVRITTCDTLMASLLPSVLASFRSEHPTICLEATTGNYVSNLSERNADVALRTGDSPTDTLLGQRVGDVGFAIYGSRVCRDWVGMDPLSYPRWLSPDATMGGMGISKWLQSTIRPESIVFRADSLVTLRQAAVSGLGLVPLPCYLGDRTPGLERVPSEALAHLNTGLWVLTHPDLRYTSRIRAFSRHAAQELKEALSKLDHAG